MEVLEREILKALRGQPERNPDGKLWRLHWGSESWTKAYILDNWFEDSQMKHCVIEAILALKIHVLGRGPPE